jgi:peptide/nickel transport system ATP-binding protein
MENMADGGNHKVFLKSLEISESEYRENQKKIYAHSALLKVENLLCRFPSKRNIFGKVQEYVNAVDDVSFEIFPGETLGLVGESGCGKTTLGRAVLRMFEPEKGKIIYHGKDITPISLDAFRIYRKQMQIIFQDPYSSLNPRLTVGSAITEPMRVHQLYGKSKQQRAKAIALLERVGLGEEHFNRYPHEFSGGQRQRICIARTLAVNPEFIICDESVSALDISVQAQVLNLLNELKREFGFTYLFISHDLSVVRFMSDRILVMQQGKIVESGDANEIYHSPKHPYTKKLIEAIPGV